MVGPEIFPSLEKLKATNQRMSDATDYRHLQNRQINGDRLEFTRYL